MVLLRKLLCTILWSYQYLMHDVSIRMGIARMWGEKLTVTCRWLQMRYLHLTLWSFYGWYGCWAFFPFTYTRVEDECYWRHITLGFFARTRVNEPRGTCKEEITVWINPKYSQDLWSCTSQVLAVTINVLSAGSQAPSGSLEVREGKGSEWPGK